MSDNSKYGILVVDDDEPVVKNMRRVLRRKGFANFVSALNGEQGIKLLETAQTDFFLIMSDQRMPGMSGSEFLEETILISPESRRMLITGYSDLDAIVSAVNRGEIHQYISKPWDNEDLLLRISGELDIYKNFQERKRLSRVTNNQNKKLADLAATQKKGLQKFAKALEQRKKEADDLTREIQEAKEQAEYKEVFLGLDELLSRTITMNKANLIQAFKIARKETSSMMETIFKNIKKEFSPEDIVADEQTDLADETYDLIDQIIENVVIAAEPDLFGIGSEPDTGVVIDDYKDVPDFEVVAFNDGFITKGEREKALDELEAKEAESSTGLTIDKVLIQNEFIRRQDLSRIFAKLAMIETRLLDRELARMMMDRDIAVKKDIDRAFKKQLNNFEDSGVAMLLGDILVESEIITPGIRDEIMAAQDRSGRKKKAVDESSQFSSEFGAFVDLQVSENRVEAWIRVPKSVHGTSDIAPVKQLMKKRGIKYGIVDDEKIRVFIKECSDPHEKFVVARGIAASVGNPAQINYNFNTESDSAGVINEDGSIDFTARGDSPFVKKGDVLAEKIPMQQPKSGMDVFGETLLVGGVDDIALEGGDGVEFSEDGLKLISTITGQPSMDVKGVVSVLETFTVNGDVDFKTGNINFNGNVIVKGMVKEGFRVECEALTVNEIKGGIIDIRGDLKVSNGVVNAKIQTQGSVQAKFFNKTKLYGYKDMMVTREIMESYIILSGALNNEAGRITASTIAARAGLSVKQVGTEKAEYSTIKAGTDDHIKWVASGYEQKTDKKQKALDMTIAQRNDHDEEYNSLHVDIANQTFAQEKITKKMDYLENQIGEVKDKDQKAKIVKELKDLEETVQKADKRIKVIFEKQDIAQAKSKECEKQIEKLNGEIKAINDEKDKIIQALEKEEAVPELKVTKRVYTGTKIMGTGSSMILRQDYGASKFTEIDSQDSESPRQMSHQTMKL